MAETTGISWTHHTFNPWRGCTKVSAGCRFCYADAMSGRNPTTLGKWGPLGTRPVAAEAYWRQPVRWNREAADAGERRRVFCASLADVFEGHETMPSSAVEGVARARARLFKLIEDTPHLDWLLLTKRPQNVMPMWQAWGEPGKDFFPNVWIGTSVEDQAAADARIPHLLRIPARVRFLSCEPLLGELDLRRYLPIASQFVSRMSAETGAITRPLDMGWIRSYRRDGTLVESEIHWVIAGGESGPNARPMHPKWARSLAEQCRAAGVPFHFKQHGEWIAMSQLSDGGSEEFYAPAPERDPEAIRRCKVPTTVLQLDGSQRDDYPLGAMLCFKVGPKRAGRMLNGVLHDAFPEVRT